MLHAARSAPAKANVGLVVTLAGVLFGVLAAGAGCSGRTATTGDDAGASDVIDAGHVDAGGEGEGEGEGEDQRDAGSVGEGEGEGEADAGPVDAGNGFDLGALLDGGLPDELSCLPTSLPALSIAGAFDALGFSPYAGRSEPGVKCGDVTCDPSVPCCVLCGAGACAGTGDAGVPECPAFTASYACDGKEECARGEVCCFTLSGTECRAEADCDFDVTGALSQFIVDGGIALPEPPPPSDAGFLDGGFTDVVALDGGFADGGVLVLPGDDGGVVDAGFVPGAPLDGGFAGGDPIDGGPAPGPDAGSLLDGLQQTLDQGVPVCTSTLLGCDVFQLELCCTSDRLTAVDVGFCLPAALCVGSVLP